MTTKENNMYEYKSKLSNTHLKVNKYLNDQGGAIVEIMHVGKLNAIALGPNEAILFAKAVLKAAGGSGVVVPLVKKKEIEVGADGSITCGTGKERAMMLPDANMEEAQEYLSNVATVVEWTKGVQAQRERDKVEGKRLEVAALLGIEMPLTGEGLRALDEVIKMRKDS